MKKSMARVMRGVSSVERVWPNSLWKGISISRIFLYGGQDRHGLRESRLMDRGAYGIDGYESED